ncbi:MAG: signal peptidase II [Nitrospirota bacterium]
MKNKYLQVGSIIGLVLALDQFTKYVVEARIRLHDVIIVVPGFFNLTHIRNKGAAFGILSNLPEFWRGAFFITVTIVAVAAIVILIVKTHERLSVYALSLIAGGALGNLVDRIRYGEVVDFIQWYVKSYYWPSFNVADSAVTLGVVLLAVEMLFGTSAKSQALNPRNK